MASSLIASSLVGTSMLIPTLSCDSPSLMLALLSSAEACASTAAFSAEVLRSSSSSSIRFASASASSLSFSYMSWLISYLLRENCCYLKAVILSTFAVT